MNRFLSRATFFAAVLCFQSAYASWVCDLALSRQIVPLNLSQSHQPLVSKLLHATDRLAHFNLNHQSSTDAILDAGLPVRIVSYYLLAGLTADQVREKLMAAMVDSRGVFPSLFPSIKDPLVGQFQNGVLMTRHILEQSDTNDAGIVRALLSRPGLEAYTGMSVMFGPSLEIALGETEHSGQTYLNRAAAYQMLNLLGESGGLDALVTAAKDPSAFALLRSAAAAIGDNYLLVTLGMSLAANAAIFPTLTADQRNDLLIQGALFIAEVGEPYLDFSRILLTRLAEFAKDAETKADVIAFAHHQEFLPTEAINAQVSIVLNKFVDSQTSKDLASSIIQYGRSPGWLLDHAVSRKVADRLATDSKHELDLHAAFLEAQAAAAIYARIGDTVKSFQIFNETLAIGMQLSTTESLLQDLAQTMAFTLQDNADRNYLIGQLEASAVQIRTEQEASTLRDAHLADIHEAIKILSLDINYESYPLDKKADVPWYLRHVTASVAPLSIFNYHRSLAAGTPVPDDRTIRRFLNTASRRDFDAEIELNIALSDEAQLERIGDRFAAQSNWEFSVLAYLAAAFVVESKQRR